MTEESSFLANLIKHQKNADRDPLSPLIDDYLLQRELPKNRSKRITEYIVPLRESLRPPGRFSPSSIGGCMRRAAFVFVGMSGQRRIDPDLEMIFEDGKWRHHRYQAMFLDMQSVLGRKAFKVHSIEETVAIPSLHVSGSLDALVEIEKQKIVVDFKGANEWSWKYIHDNQRPKEEHRWQLMTYMRARKIKRGVLLYENKGSQERQCFYFDFSGDDWAEIKEWVVEVTLFMDRRDLPPRHADCSNGLYMGGKCPFRKHCWGDATDDEVTELAYVDFVSMKDSWSKGLKIIEEDR